MRERTRYTLIAGALLVALLPSGCGDQSSDAGADLPLGDLSEADAKFDGEWGAALTCKTPPDLPPLASPKIFISLQGLTLRLVDESAGFEKVFPIGPGVIDQSPTSATFGESMSYYPLIATGGHSFSITPAAVQPCKIWWTDPATGQRSPVFAGLPFLSWYGNYGIHGPIDNYRAANGGTLRRGFVSHGCIRMEAADILEVYARTKGVARVPVWVQREPERTPADVRVDVPEKWIGAECAVDGDCNFPRGFCKLNRYSGRGFCSAHCNAYCSDRTGYPVTFCVTDPDDTTQGMCVAKVTSVNYKCRPGDHLVPVSRTRFTQPSVSATVCVPGSPGWVGDRCFYDSECQTGNTCEGAVGDAPGICTRTCSRYCPDMPGWPATFCVENAALGGRTCVRQCSPETNASECPGGVACVATPRAGEPTTVRNVCEAP
jgi:hypothetical protein